MTTETGWLESRIETVNYGNPLAEFAGTINPLTINSNMIHGNTLVGGCGGGFPERVMLCSPESNFSSLESSINSLTCADCEFFTDPSLLLDSPVERKFSEDKPSLEQRNITYYLASLQTLLSSIDDSSFDTILFFRIQKLQEQLTTGLYKQLARVIKPQGYLLGSGSFKSIQDCQAIFQEDFLVE